MNYAELFQTVRAAHEWLRSEPERAWYRTYDAALTGYGPVDDNGTGDEAYAYHTATSVHGFTPDSYKGER